MSRHPHRHPVARAFGRTLRAARREANMTREEVVAACDDFVNCYYTSVELGFRSPSIVDMFAIAQAVKIAPTELIRRTVLALQSDDDAEGDQS